MTVQEMIYQFKLQAQRVDTKTSAGLAIAQIIIYLNMGMEQLLKRRYSTNNNYQASLEAIQKRIDEWQRLIVPHEDLPLSLFKDYDNVYFANLKDTKQRYLFLLRTHFEGSKDKCNKQRINTFFSASDDLNVDLDNPDAKPNFDWRETLHRLAEDKILAYSDGTFSLDIANIDYLRYPKPIDAKGFKHFDGTDSVDQECELPAFLHSEIINEAILCFNLGQNQPGTQAAAGAKQIEE